MPKYVTVHIFRMPQPICIFLAYFVLNTSFDYSRPRVALAITEDCYFCSCYLFFSVHRFVDVVGPIFVKLCHTTRHVLKLIMSYMGVYRCPLKLKGENPNFRRFADPKSTLPATSFHSVREIGKSKTIMSICG